MKLPALLACTYIPLHLLSLHALLLFRSSFAKHAHTFLHTYSLYMLYCCSGFHLLSMHIHSSTPTLSTCSTVALLLFRSSFAKHAHTFLRTYSLYMLYCCSGLHLLSMPIHSSAPTLSTCSTVVLVFTC